MLVNATVHEIVSLPRRLGAMIYDGLLLIALLMVAEFLVGSAFGITEDHPLFMPVRLYAPLLALGFLGWFWTRPAGQTLGMQAWHVRLARADHAPVHWRQASIRFVVALAQWCLVLATIALYLKGWWLLALALAALIVGGLVLAHRHPQRLMLHDILSGTRLLRARKP
ncbi:MAG TPA: RDD family protein [Thioalkalivibrio sp.]|nr:RDD family protein [Thioalkalivibrio sp.]